MLAVAGGRMVAGNRSLPGIWGQPAEPARATFDVRRFGARGNGRADDSKAFAAALAAAAVTGGIVTVPAGKYRVLPMLHVRSGVTVRGIGVASIVRGADGDPIVFAAGDVHDVEVSDLTIEGRYSHGILLDRVTSGRVSRCHVSGASIPRHGLASGVFIVGSTGVTVQQCQFERNGFDGPGESADIQCNGLGARSQEINIIGNKCLSTGVSVNVRCYSTSRSTVRDNEISGARVMGAQNHGYGILIYPTSGQLESCFENVIERYHISKTHGSGIYMVRCDRSSVIVNVIEDVATLQGDDSLPVAGIALNGSQFVAVRGNRIVRSGKAGVSLATDRAGTGNSQIRGNTILGAAGYGIHLRGALSDLHVEGNTITETHGGIGTDFLAVQERIVIADNELTDVIGGAAIKLTNARRSSVTGNRIRRGSGMALDIAFGDDASVASNNALEGDPSAEAPGEQVRIVRRPR